MDIKVDLISLSKAPTPSLMSWLQGFDARYLRVAKASNEKGPMLYVYFVRVDDAYLITSVVFDPRTKKGDEKPAGDAVDIFLEQLAQIEGVTRLFMCKSGDECALINTFPTRITSVSKLQAPAHAVYLN